MSIRRNKEHPQRSSHLVRRASQHRQWRGLRLFSKTYCTSWGELPWASLVHLFPWHMQILSNYSWTSVIKRQRRQESMAFMFFLHPHVQTEQFNFSQAFNAVFRNPGSLASGVVRKSRMARGISAQCGVSMTAIKQPKSARNCSSGNRQKHECFLIVFDETIQEPGFSFTHVKLLK